MMLCAVMPAPADAGLIVDDEG